MHILHFPRKLGPTKGAFYLAKYGMLSTALSRSICKHAPQRSAKEKPEWGGQGRRGRADEEPCACVPRLPLGVRGREGAQTGREGRTGPPAPGKSQGVAQKRRPGRYAGGRPEGGRAPAGSEEARGRRPGSPAGRVGAGRGCATGKAHAPSPPPTPPSPPRGAPHLLRPLSMKHRSPQLLSTSSFSPSASTCASMAPATGKRAPNRHRALRGPRARVTPPRERKCKCGPRGGARTPSNRRRALSRPAGAAKPEAGSWTPNAGSAKPEGGSLLRAFLLRHPWRPAPPLP